MKIDDLLEGVVTPEDEANTLSNELQAILDDVGVAAYGGIRVSAELANESMGMPAGTFIYTPVIPEIKNGEYDADEADVALRLAHRLINKWLAQKEADGQFVVVSEGSDVGGGNKFSTYPYSVWTGAKHIDVPGFHMAVTIANKEDTVVVK
jgi:hypothetical protein